MNKIWDLPWLIIVLEARMKVLRIFLNERISLTIGWPKSRVSSTN
jgi:hypothetical protein